MMSSTTSLEERVNFLRSNTTTSLASKRGSLHSHQAHVLESHLRDREERMNFLRSGTSNSLASRRGSLEGHLRANPPAKIGTTRLQETPSESVGSFEDTPINPSPHPLWMPATILMEDTPSSFEDVAWESNLDPIPSMHKEVVEFAGFSQDLEDIGLPARSFAPGNDIFISHAYPQQEKPTSQAVRMDSSASVER